MPMRLAWISIFLWTVSLALPVGASVFEYMGGPVDPQSLLGPWRGFDYLQYGVFGPLVIDEWARDLPGFESWPHWQVAGVPLAAFGWYAHPLWAWNMMRMLWGEAPRPIPALTAAALALCALQPFHIGVFDDHGVDSMTVPLEGAFVWAVAMAIPLAVLVDAALARLWARRSAP